MKKKILKSLFASLVILALLPLAATAQGLQYNYLDIVGDMMLEQVSFQFESFARDRGLGLMMERLECSNSALGLAAIAPIDGAMLDFDHLGVDLAVVHHVPSKLANRVLPRGTYTVRLEEGQVEGYEVVLVDTRGEVVQRTPIVVDVMPEASTKEEEDLSIDASIRIRPADGLVAASLHGICWGAPVGGHAYCWLIPIDEVIEDEGVN